MMVSKRGVEGNMVTHDMSALASLFVRVMGTWWGELGNSLLGYLVDAGGILLWLDWGPMSWGVPEHPLCASRGLMIDVESVIFSPFVLFSYQTSVSNFYS